MVGRGTNIFLSFIVVGTSKHRLKAFLQKNTIKNETCMPFIGSQIAIDTEACRNRNKNLTRIDNYV